MGNGMDDGTEHLQLIQELFFFRFTIMGDIWLSQYLSDITYPPRPTSNMLPFRTISHPIDPSKTLKRLNDQTVQC